MVQRADYCRLAVTVFDQSEQLWRTVAVLFDAGLQVEQFCPIALSEIVPRFVPSGSAAHGLLDHASRLFKDMQEWPDSENGRGIVATSGPLFEILTTSMTLTNQPRAISKPSNRKPSPTWFCRAVPTRLSLICCR